MKNIDEIIATLQTVASDMEAERAHGDMLRRKLRQADSDLVSARYSADLARKRIVELQINCTEELRKRDERIAELKKQLRTAKRNADFWRNQADHWEDAAHS